MSKDRLRIKFPAQRTEQGKAFVPNVLKIFRYSSSVEMPHMHKSTFNVNEKFRFGDWEDGIYHIDNQHLFKLT